MFNNFQINRNKQNKQSQIQTVWLLSISIGVLLLTGCNYDTRDAGRSGSYQDDRLETPLHEDFVQYDNALKVSNKILDLMKAHDSQAIADEYVLEELKPLLGEKEIKELMSNAEKKYGKIVSYKPMQWGFEPRVENGKGDKSEFNRIIAEKYGDKKVGKKIPILFSIKIVQHEQATVSYWFQFPADGKYEKVLGIFYKQYEGTRNIGQF